MCAAAIKDRRPHIKAGSSYKTPFKKTLWSYYFEGNVEIPEICIYSLNLQCPDERKGCSRLHSKNKWHWQILHNNQWYNLTHTQSNCIERSFLIVETDEVVIPPVNPEKCGRLGEELVKLLWTDRWRADFRQMKLLRLNHSDYFHMRRLSTPSKEKFKSKYSSEFRWYLQEEDQWVEFGARADMYSRDDNGSSNCEIPSTTSSEIEKQYQKNQSEIMTLNVQNNKCKLIFSKMELKFRKPKRTVPVQRRPINTDMIYPSVWSYHIQGEVEIPEICMNTEGETCTLGYGCGRLHSEVPWHWQFFYEGVWYNMPKVQRYAVEKAYMDVWEDNVEMPAINVEKMGNLGKEMSKILGLTKWLVNFVDMTMTSSIRLETTLNVRRLSTPSKLKSTEDNATEFVWFFKNDDDCWVEFGCEDTSEDSQLTSYEIEKCYSSGKWDVMDVTIADGSFELNFSSMTLKDENTSEEIPVRRRPQQARSNLMETRSMRKVKLSENSKEYNDAYSSLLLSLKLPQVTSIERVQNPSLWKIFKKRCNDLSVPTGDEVLNIHTLFHWVSLEYVDEVCRENLQWKHQCQEIKSMCRKKRVCFFKSANFDHDRCCSPYERDHRLFVFRVIVGTMKGPQDSSNADFDTEVDDSYMPTKFFKCDDRDYIPAYVMTL